MVCQHEVSFLVEENRQYAGSGGVSANNAGAEFIPAFKDSLTGRTERSRFRDGRPAPFHLIDGLPDDWLAVQEDSGSAFGVKETIVCGFLRLGRFYTRKEAADFMASIGF